MCDILVIVVRFDVLDGQARILVTQAAAVARDESESTGLSREVILADDERRERFCAAEVAGDGLELIGRGSLA
jgi:hypothetical protein